MGWKFRAAPDHGASGAGGTRVRPRPRACGEHPGRSGPWASRWRFLDRPGRYCCRRGHFAGRALVEMAIGRPTRVTFCEPIANLQGDPVMIARLRGRDRGVALAGACMPRGSRPAWHPGRRQFHGQLDGGVKARDRGPRAPSPRGMATPGKCRSALVSELRLLPSMGVEAPMKIQRGPLPVT